jgi:MED6 mediator sub complex component
MSTLSHRNQAFLVSEGLSPKTVVDYFCESPFYTRSGGFNSLNESVRKGLKLSIEQALHDQQEDESVEWFELVHSNSEGLSGFVDESIFVIQKFYKRHPNLQKQHREVFYVLAGTIFEAINLGGYCELICTNVLNEFNSVYHKLTEEKTITKLDLLMDEVSPWPDFVKFHEETSVEPGQVALLFREELR